MTAPPQHHREPTKERTRSASTEKKHQTMDMVLITCGGNGNGGCGDLAMSSANREAVAQVQCKTENAQIDTATYLAHEQAELIPLFHESDVQHHNEPNS